MRIAERMDNVPGSGTLEILSLANELENEGKDVIHLEVGQPDFNTPEHIKESAKKSLDEGDTGYAPSAGKPELRTAISNSLDEREIDRDSEEIVVTPGAKHSLFSAMTVALDHSDEIIIPTPCWTYEGMVRIINAAPVFVEAPEEKDFQLNPEEVKEAVSSKTKMILLNYPNNPTGVALEKETLHAVADLAVDHDFWILTDEIYDRITYEKIPDSIASLSKYKDRTIYINGFSKTYAMTGWRLGYTAAPKEIISEMVKIQQNSTTCPTSFVQTAGVTALEGPQEKVREMRTAYEERRNVIVEGLNSIEGIECVKPQGAFYVFPNIEDLGEDSMSLCKYLLQESGVAATPGSAFGPAGEGHLRLSYANSIQRIREALNRIKEAVSDF